MKTAELCQQISAAFVTAVQIQRREYLRIEMEMLSGHNKLFRQVTMKPAVSLGGPVTVCRRFLVIQIKSITAFFC